MLQPRQRQTLSCQGKASEGPGASPETEGGGALDSLDTTESGDVDGSSDDWITLLLGINWLLLEWISLVNLKTIYLSINFVNIYLEHQHHT